MKHQLRNANTQLFSYFVFFALIGSAVFHLPFLYRSGHPVPYIDGLFTAVSALCVTGLSSVDMSVYSPAGFVVLLFFIEIGGLGLVTFFTIYLAFPSKKISLVNRNLIRDYFIADVTVGVRQILLRIVLVTFTVQTIGAVVLSMMLNKTGERHFIFYGIFLSISAFCNAGFTPYSEGLHQFYQNYAFCITICLLVICGGLGFTVFNDIASWIHHKFFLKKKGSLRLHTKIVFFMTVLLIVSGTIFILLAEKNNAFKNMSFFTALNNAFFQSVTLRTAGFDTVSQSSFSVQTMLLSLVLMLVGGSPGSMAGGLKTTTIFLVCCYTFRSGNDRGNLSVYNRDISWSVLEKAVGIVTKAFFLLFVLLVLLSITERNALQGGIFSFSDLVYETVSAFGTVGVSKGVTSLLSHWGKLLIIFTMLAGRTGVVALALGIFSGNAQKAMTDYPREDVLVG